MLFLGFWNPSELNDNPEHYSERGYVVFIVVIIVIIIIIIIVVVIVFVGTNSLEMLAYLTSAYSITGKNKKNNNNNNNNNNSFIIIIVL